MSFFARIFLIALLTAAPAAVHAAKGEDASLLFSASGIRVDVTAENAALARDEALKKGQKKALMIVLARLTPPDVLERLPELIPDAIDNLVQDMGVSNEKTSPVRYMATLEIRFNADAVRDILKDNGLPFVREAGKKLLVLPLFKKSASSTALLFENDNAWLRAWANRSKRSYMVPLSVPLGDLSDMQSLSAEKVVGGDLDAVDKLSARYGTEGVLIAEMVRKGAIFSVSVRAMDNVTASEIPNFSFNMPLTKNTANTYAMAVSKIVDHIENVWKREKMVRFNETVPLIAMVPVSGVGQWEIVSERLKRIPSVASFSLQAARPGLLQVTLLYVESLERLTKEMSKRMLALTPLPGGVYKLQLSEDQNFFAPDEDDFVQTTLTPQQEREIPVVSETPEAPQEEKIVWQVAAPETSQEEKIVWQVTAPETSREEKIVWQVAAPDAKPRSKPDARPGSKQNVKPKSRSNVKPKITWQKGP